MLASLGHLLRPAVEAVRHSLSRRDRDQWVDAVAHLSGKEARVLAYALLSVSEQLK